ncbi:MAG: MATE family efflux transporter [Clostridiales bacterium]|nr:MATE family efflux transporter [Clostridiales bacterium]
MQLDRKSMLKLLMPVLVDQLFITLLPMANTIIVSKLGQSSMSSVSVIDQVNQLVSFTIVAIGFGGAVMAAQYVGKGDQQAVRRVVKQSYSSSLMVACLATALVTLFNGAVIKLALGNAAGAEMISAARTYLMITCISYPFYCFYSNTTQVLRGVGEPRKAMYMSVLMNLSNFALSLLFIYGFRLGIQGAALASLLGRVIGTLLGLLLVSRTGICTRLSDFFTFKLDLATQKTMIRLGVPTGMQSFFFVGARLVMNRFILDNGGAMHLSANVVFTQILDLQCTGSTFVIGMAPAIMGMAKGRGDQEGMVRAFKDLCFFAFWFGLVFSILPVTLAGQFPKIYNLQPESALIAKRMITWNPLYIAPLVWFAQVAPASFRGIGDSIVPPIITIGALWGGRVVTIAVLTTFFGFGAYASYFAVAVDYILRTILYAWRYKSGAWLRAQRGVDE